MLLAGSMLLFARPASAADLCNGLRPTRTGTERADAIRGTAGRDVINALGGNDRIRGLGGNDVICAGAGDDDVDGGPGDDLLRGADGADVVRGAAGNDVVAGGMGDDVLFGGLGYDELHGDNQHRYPDYVCASPTPGGADQMHGYEANDLMYGCGGDDLMVGEAGGDVLVGGLGDDRYVGGSGVDHLSLVDDAALPGSDSIDGGADDDLIGIQDGVPDDSADGGAGSNDACGRDPGETLVNCEVVDDIIWPFSLQAEDLRTIDDARAKAERHKALQAVPVG